MIEFPHKEIMTSFQRLRAYCEKERFQGWDPYDGLNSKMFHAFPGIRDNSFLREVIIQFFKRSPINLRSFALVPKGYNPKGLGLFLSGYCNLYRIPDNLRDGIIAKEDCLEKIGILADLLLSQQSKGYSGACWGYNFDWQSKAFFLPKWTPTVVATSFVVEALLSAYSITGEKAYYDTALSSADFILKDLNRIEKPNGYMFSYSPLDKRAVYNATLLGSKTLALLYSHTKDAKLKEAAGVSAQCVCDVQNPDGSFPHSDQVGNNWRDSFHTGFKLESLQLYQDLCGDTSFASHIESGYNYWIQNFFDREKGTAFYYDRGMQPTLVDLHCVAQAMATFYKLDRMGEQIEFATDLLLWTIANMQSKEGFFYFQKKGVVKTKIPYMRWPNAWMFYGLSYWLNFNSRHDD